MKHIIFLSGGGTAGSVTPLLAIAEMFSAEKNYSFIWFGTTTGPEKKLVTEIGLPFIALSAGKWRRYFSWQNFFDLFKIIIGFCQSFYYLAKYRPRLVINAGSYVGAPLVLAAKIWRTKIIVHQQDAIVGLANRLTAPLADCITTALEVSAQSFKKSRWTGNPLRRHYLAPINQNKLDDFRRRCGLVTDQPIILFFGGGTGSADLNQILADCLPALLNQFQIIHLTGAGKKKLPAQKNYFAADFLNNQEMTLAYHASCLVVSRAGMGAISELAFFAKAAIIIPLPDSHQLANARQVSQAQAALILDQKKITASKLNEAVIALNADQARQEQYRRQWRVLFPSDPNQIYYQTIKQILAAKPSGQ